MVGAAAETDSPVAHARGSAIDDGLQGSADPPDGGTLEPAPALKIVPARKPGWNKLTVTQILSDLSVYFSDALIVWKGSAAYSANANTTALIGTTSGVSALTSLDVNDEVWVKY